jgi:bifunctional DNA-binding transcriptional regulator/antitoxin component of YhaV-PrlF toxin-antitoxin module
MVSGILIRNGNLRGDTMATITFASKLKDDGSINIPEQAVEQLGIHPGDEVQVRVETTNGAGHIAEPDQVALQAKFDCFFAKLDTLTFEQPPQLPEGDKAEAAFTRAMDEKYGKLGFK